MASHRCVGSERAGQVQSTARTKGGAWAGRRDVPRRPSVTTAARRFLREEES